MYIYLKIKYVYKYRYHGTSYINRPKKKIRIEQII